MKEVKITPLIVFILCLGVFSEKLFALETSECYINLLGPFQGGGLDGWGYTPDSGWKMITKTETKYDCYDLAIFYIGERFGYGDMYGAIYVEWEFNDGVLDDSNGVVSEHSQVMKTERKDLEACWLEIRDEELDWYVLSADPKQPNKNSLVGLYSPLFSSSKKTLSFLLRLG